MKLLDAPKSSDLGRIAVQFNHAVSNSLKGEMKKESLKQQQFKIADSKRLKGSSKANGFEFEVTGNLKWPTLN